MHLIEQLQPKRMLDFGSGNPPRLAIAACNRVPELEAWCVDEYRVEERSRIYSLPSRLFMVHPSSELKEFENKFDFAHSAFVFHEICDDWERGEQKGGIHTPEAWNVLSSIYRCLRNGGCFELVDYVACEFYHFLNASGKQQVLQDAKHKKLADTVYEACICTEPAGEDLEAVVGLLASEFGRGQAEMKSLLLRLFMEYPRLPGPQIAAEKDELIRLILHFRKYKDHHTRCPPDKYKERIREVGFHNCELWTPDGTRYQFICIKK
jgi:SAM-dependent methyltransferase